jgi:hypothetical protein
MTKVNTGVKKRHVTAPEANIHRKKGIVAAPKFLAGNRNRVFMAKTGIPDTKRGIASLRS